MRLLITLGLLIAGLASPFFVSAAAVVDRAAVVDKAAEEQRQLPIAIQGYSVVSYFTEGEAQLGDSRYFVEHEGKRYLFTSAAQAKLFRADPVRFKPRYEHCPYSASLGMTLPLDPTNFKIIGGYLLLFHKSDTVDGLAEWRKSGLSQEELLERADNSITLLKF